MGRMKGRLRDRLKDLQMAVYTTVVEPVILVGIERMAKFVKQQTHNI